MNIRSILDSGSVVRYHSTLIDKKQTNDQHSWEVGVILRHIYPQASADLLFYALIHDSGEIYTSDVSAPMKREYPQIKELLDQLETKYATTVHKIPPMHFTDEEHLAVKYADILSGLYFTTRRVAAGDKEAVPIRDNWLEYLGGMKYLNETTLNTIEALKV